MQKDTWAIIGVMVALVGLLATFMVTSLASIESRLTAMDANFSERLAVMDSHYSERLAAMDANFSARLTVMETHFSERLAAMDGRLHEINTRLSRIEGHLGLPADVEPIRFQTIGFAAGAMSTREFEYVYQSAPHLPGSCALTRAGWVYGNSPSQRIQVVLREPPELCKRL